MKREWALAAFGLALAAASVQANGGDLPKVVDAKSVRADSAVAAPAAARGLEELSPGNRLIAQALYNAQKAGSVTGRKPWSLERVAQARAGGRNWGQIFQQMKQEGLVEAETLGQVVTWYQYHQVTPAGGPQDPVPSLAVMQSVKPKPAQ